MNRKKKSRKLVGQRFGRLTVIDRSDDYVSPKGVHLAQWLCECDCGGRVIATTPNLKYGRVKSCGCINTKNILGQRFGRLKVIARADDYIGTNGVHRTKWLCRCDCGVEKEIQARYLLEG